MSFAGRLIASTLICSLFFCSGYAPAFAQSGGDDAAMEALTNQILSDDNANSGAYDNDLSQLIDNELARAPQQIDVNSNAFKSFAADHPIAAAVLVAAAIGGIVALSVAIPLGVRAHHHHNNNAQLTAAYLNYSLYNNAHQPPPLVPKESPRPIPAPP